MERARTAPPPGPAPFRYERGVAEELPGGDAGSGGLPVRAAAGGGRGALRGGGRTEVRPSAESGRNEMAVRPEEIASIIRQQIEQFGGVITAVDMGTVVEAGDGIARVHGLRGAMYNELLEFPDSVMGVALNLEEETVGAIILGDYQGIKEGDEVRSTGRIVETPVGDGLVGRVVDPLGQPLDGKGPAKSDKTRSGERIAPNVVMRES